MKIDHNDPRPPFRQIADDLRKQIERGKPGRGEKLDSIKQLAAESGAAITRIATWILVPHADSADCRVDPGHASLEFDAAELMASYARNRRNVSIFQDGDDFTVYHIDLSK